MAYKMCLNWGYGWTIIGGIATGAGIWAGGTGGTTIEAGSSY